MQFVPYFEVAPIHADSAFFVVPSTPMAVP